MKEIIKKIKQSKRVAIIAHVSPDADCLSSMSALYCILKQFGKECSMFVDCDKFKEYISFYKFNLPLNTELNANDFDTIFTVDVPQITMLGKYSSVVLSHSNVVCIDHHPTNNIPAQTKFVDSDFSSCSEIIYKIAEQLKAKITPEIASFIYAGIIGDTNCFQNDNTNSNTFITASNCLVCGAEKNLITFLFQKHQTYEEMILKKLAYENLIISDKIGYVILTKKMLKEANTDDCPMLVNEILNTGDNLFAFVIKQKDKNTYSVSLRCKEGYNVAKIASTFGGGGHVQASGFMFTGSPTKYAKLIKIECEKQIEGSNVWTRCNNKFK